MNLTIDKLQQSQLRADVPEFRSGDTVRIHVRLREAEIEKGKEKEKERIQTFEGVVISRRGQLLSATFTVRRVSFGIGVERIFPVHSPMIAQIEVVRRGSPPLQALLPARAAWQGRTHQGQRTRRAAAKGRGDGR